MAEYTVLLLHPDHRWDQSHPSDWVTRHWVETETVDAAVTAAQTAAFHHFDDNDPERGNPDNYAVLAVYSGHITDHFTP